MDEIRQKLAPLTDWIPPEYLDLLPLEAWWLIEAVVALAVLVILGTLARAMLRQLPRRRPKIDWDRELREDLDALPVAAGPALLTVYHIPARIRLLVVAPGGKGVVVQPTLLPALLDRIVPGLGTVVQRDRPRICVWPAPLSNRGFSNTFHRCTLTRDRAGEPSRWVLLAGRVLAGQVPLFVGLALWTDEPTALGRLNLTEEEWRGVLVRRAAEKEA
jgi:hypothetical protein